MVTNAGAFQMMKSAPRKQPMIGRNDPCPCGSGKKYKDCHGRAEAEAAAPKPAAARKASAAPRQSGFVPPAKAPVLNSRGPSLFTAKRAAAWLLLAAISAAMPFAMYFFYIVYIFLMESLAKALPGVYKVVDFLFNEVGETTVCGVLAGGVFYIFADQLFFKAEKLCPARVGLRYLVLGLLMFGAALAGFLYCVNHQTETGGRMYPIMYTLYAVLLDGIFLIRYLLRFGNPRLLFWKKKVTVFAYQPADKATFYAKITGGPGLITLGGDIDRVNLAEMIKRNNSLMPDAAAMPGQLVFCCTIDRSEGAYVFSDYIAVEAVDLQAGYFVTTQCNARALESGHRGMKLPHAAENLPEIPYVWK